MKTIILNTAFFLLAFLTGIQFTNAQWVQKGIDIDGEAAGDYSGQSVSMPDANTIAIGAYGNDGTGSSAGHVRIYSWNGTAWMQKGIDIDGETILDYSGISVNMPDPNTVAIGAYFNDANGTDAGHVRIHSWNGAAWVQKGADIDGEAAGDRSGYAVSMPDSNTVAIGAYLNSGAGHIRIYSWNGAAWVQKGTDIDGEAAGDWSAHSVSMPDANTVAIGAPKNDGTGTDAGHVRIYTWNGLTWMQKGADIDGEASYDNSGYSVSMSDSNTIAIGANANDGTASNAGHVRIYSWNGVSWLQKGTDIDGEAADDYSGTSVSMADSNTVAIGAEGNDGNNIFSGHVRIYSWNGTGWVQKGIDIDGETAVDFSGRSVSMPNAGTVAIGAPFNYGNGMDAGHARVYSFDSPTGVPDFSASQMDESSVINVFPNPSQDAVSVLIGSPYDMETEIQVFNYIGQKLHNRAEKIRKGLTTISIDISSYASGIYMFKVTTPDGTYMSKEFIKR